MTTYCERELTIEFPDDVKWIELDVQGQTLPNGMALVDLVIERENDFLLVEIKDPSDSKCPPENRAEYLNRLRTDELLDKELVPKVRDSYTYEHLMGRDSKPFIYIVLLGLDAFSEQIQKALLSTFADRLIRGVRTESHEPWKRQHVSNCIVMAVDVWNKNFADWQIIRIPV